MRCQRPLCPCALQLWCFRRLSFSNTVCCGRVLPPVRSFPPERLREERKEPISHKTIPGICGLRKQPSPFGCFLIPPIPAQQGGRLYSLFFTLFTGKGPVTEVAGPLSLILLGFWCFYPIEVKCYKSEKWCVFVRDWLQIGYKK